MAPADPRRKARARAGAPRCAAPAAQQADLAAQQAAERQKREQQAAAMLQHNIFSVSKRPATQQHATHGASNRNTSLFALSGNLPSHALAMPSAPTGKKSGAASSTAGNSQALVGTQELVMQMGQVGTGTLLGQPVIQQPLQVKAPPTRRPDQQDTVELRAKTKAAGDEVRRCSTYHSR